MPQTRHRWIIALCVLGMFTFGGVVGSASEQEGITFASEHVRFTASFSDDEVHIVMSDGKQFRLPQHISASGARYTDGEIQFWTKGDVAWLELGDETYEVRIIDAERDPWERAQRDGVAFRGIGQEPGWVVHIWERFQVELSLHYGTTQIVTPLSGKDVDYVTNTVTYRAIPPLSPLVVRVVVEEGACYDAMSGEGFTHSVTVHIGEDQEYLGCGRYLE